MDVDLHPRIGCGTWWVSCPETFREVKAEEDLKAATTGVLGPEPLVRSAAEG